MLTDLIWGIIRGRCLRFVHFVTTGSCSPPVGFVCPLTPKNSFNVVLFEKEEANKLMKSPY